MGAGLFVGMTMCGCGNGCVCLLENPMYIYILLAQHNLGGRGVYHSINISKKLENITNDN